MERRFADEKSNEITYAKQFQEVFNKLCWTRNCGQAWADFVTITACTISNSIDKDMFDQREQLYMRTIQNYTKDELESMVNLFAITVLAFDDNPEQDFLGDIYSVLGLLNKRIGQVFTPYHIAKFMALSTCGCWAEEVKKKGFISINDPCCGSGVMLIAAANVALEQDLNYQNSVVFFGQDIDFTAAMMCYISLSLLGCVGYVAVGNSLNPDQPTRENVWHLPMNILRRKLLEEFNHSN